MILIVVGIGVALYFVYWIYQKIQDAINAGANGAAAIGKYILSGAQNIGSEVAAAASLPGLASQSAALDQQISTQDTSLYSPGGRLYNQVLASQGKAAADANWAAVQSHLATQSQQTSSWWNIWS